MNASDFGKEKFMTFLKHATQKYRTLFYGIYMQITDRRIEKYVNQRCILLQCMYVELSMNQWNSEY